ncbi:MAG: uroporphyrinogen-III synthase [Burkholderiales bacterium]
MRRPLAGRRIVVTRPRAQAAGLAALIRDAGGEPLVFPALEIRDLADPGPILALAERLEEFDLAIFVSPNAARKALDLVRARRGARPWPARLRVAAVGRGTRGELERAGFAGVIAPQAQADSEALLALPELAAVAGMGVVIFRGEGGRELLGDALAARGARVAYAECYRRARPETDGAPLLAAWARGAVDAVTVSSAQGLANLVAMLGTPGRQRLQETPLFVPHARVAAEAARLGVRETVVAGPGDAELVARLVAYFGGAK